MQETHLYQGPIPFEPHTYYGNVIQPMSIIHKKVSPKHLAQKKYDSSFIIKTTKKCILFLFLLNTFLNKACPGLVVVGVKPI